MRSFFSATLLSVGAAACTAPPGADTSPAATDSAADSADSAAGTDVATWCADQGFGQSIPWSEGPYGENRHDIADDFTVPLVDGSTWGFKDHWTGCEQFVFIPDTIVRTVDKQDSIWTKDVDDLVAGSPRNTHYFFIPNQRDDTTAQANIEEISGNVDKLLKGMDEADATWWAERLHVSAVNAKDLDGWLKGELRTGIGNEGMGIDRYQAIRGFGSLADDTRADNSNSSWPFQNNLAFAAHEARMFETEAKRQAALDAEEATLVPLWTGEVIQEYADMAVDLPSAADMATYDTFEIDIDMRCPDHDKKEPGNCGAWDYIANFYVDDGAGNWIELSRFITSYHRETHWVADATPMMAHLLAGGNRTFRWSWAPSWNVQPTETRLTLRFSNQGKGYKPRVATLVATGGSFGSTYNDGRTPVDVPISAAAKHVDLWAIITGHGAGTHSCAEFCNHQHEFTVDGAVHEQEYPMAQSAAGCVDDIEGQMTPNQLGTWWYGRGGWCPGEYVHPYVVDVTSEVGADGSATVGYRGLYKDQTPEDGSGDIVLNAWLVEYQ